MKDRNSLLPTHDASPFHTSVNLPNKMGKAPHATGIRRNMLKLSGQQTAGIGSL
jgi:hypothetical protein